ncbi:MAG: hypothetical protein F6K50_27040 [Moorea sp. SIO3I7]|nr:MULTISPECIES: hypothetical protein [Moorena]NEN99015.1 hypothetical protein [Moorena sp. SIO3I7]NEO64611.1 hypothetical protein [Moorena sp. SIO4G2]NEQ85806.1 hypothetical protein [Moorena sp. SIO2I5]NEO07794.1 hypothetical protein [Moorena sp. SIO3I8]NEQ88215.1 hypothetical protein [Moorena sp. SIO2I5]
MLFPAPNSRKHMRYAHAARTAVSRQWSAVGRWPRYANSLFYSKADS